MASTLPTGQSPAIYSIPLDSPEVLGNMLFSGVVTCSVRSYFSFSSAAFSLSPPFPCCCWSGKLPSCVMCLTLCPSAFCAVTWCNVGAHAETQSCFSNFLLLFRSCQTARPRRDFVCLSQPHPRKLLSSHDERGRHTSKNLQGRQKAECLYPRCPKC